MQALHLQSTSVLTALQHNHASSSCCSLRAVGLHTPALLAAPQPAYRRQRLQCSASSSDSFTGSSMSGNGSSFGLSGPGASSSSKPSLSIEDISLESEVNLCTEVRLGLKQKICS